ncbi:HAD hydrolase family protein [Candidatus Mycoplasma haematominutum]|uniref:Uncharacterized protein n=1 Tax=Candidatus Mycoplasma haematominutum 'Birmingham 1' TaxID=1116213 RepID=G8C3X1_9MOLU|nr:HAD hydrolase family protein [Candidatus Mycoplasma haematominutum]CCE67019.1 conserved haemoplasma hypothetical protein [Candidatus Mycoplasma haematominutum 'Birmingham 1']
MTSKNEKIIALDLDLFKSSQEYTQKEIKEIGNLLHEMSVYNNLFLFTDNSFSLAREIVGEWNLSLGYLVINSGACVYDIAAKKKLYENFLDIYIAKFILRLSFVRNYSFVVHTASDISFTYGINFITSSKYRGMNYQFQLISPDYKKLQDWFDIETLFQQHFIYSIEVFFDEFDVDLRRDKMSELLSNLAEFGIKFSSFTTEYTIYFFSKNNLKVKAMQKVLKVSPDYIYKNSMYYSLTFPDWTIAPKAFFWLTDERWTEMIQDEIEEPQVIFLSSSPKLWVKWWKQHKYVWQDDFLGFEQLNKRIKKIDFSKTKNRGNNYRNNCFEFNLETGVLSSREINEEKRRWKWDKGSTTDKSLIKLFFLWPEQLKYCQLNK